jgi:DNA-binding XRE family transcriptional regulator
VDAGWCVVTSGYGARITELRRAAGLTQVQLAEAAGLDVHTIGRYEQEVSWSGRLQRDVPRTAVHPNAAAALACVFGVTISELFGDLPLHAVGNPGGTTQQPVFRGGAQPCRLCGTLLGPDDDESACCGGLR